MEALYAMPMAVLVANAGVTGVMNEKLNEAGCTTKALVSLAATADFNVFATAVTSMLGACVEVKDWQLTVVYGYIIGRLTEINTLTASGEPPQQSPPPQVPQPPLKSAAQKDKEEFTKAMEEIQGELGIQSQTIPMTVLKGLLTEVGPDGITMREKVAKVIVQARKGDVSGNEVVMEVSGCGELVPKVAAGLGTRKAVWALARKNWSAFTTFARKVRSILSRAATGVEGEEALWAWEHFLEHLNDLAEIHGDNYAGEYFCQFTQEYDFWFSDDSGMVRKAADDKIVMMTRRAMKNVKVVKGGDEKDGKPFRKGGEGKGKNEGPCFKCGGAHGVFSCNDRCKQPGKCVICAASKTDCPNMFECSERHADSK